MIVLSFLSASPIYLLYIILLANISDVALDVNEKVSGAVVLNYLIFLQCGEGHGPAENLLKDVHCPPDKSKCAPTPRLRIPPHINKVHKTQLGIFFSP